MVASTVARSAGVRFVSIDDFLPRKSSEDESSGQSIAEQKAIVAGVLAAHQRLAEKRRTANPNPNPDGET